MLVLTGARCPISYGAEEAADPGGHKPAACECCQNLPLTTWTVAVHLQWITEIRLPILLLFLSEPKNRRAANQLGM